MKARFHVVVGIILGALLGLFFNLPMNQLFTMIVFTALVSYFIDLDHFVVYMFRNFNKGMIEIWTLNLSSLLEGMTTLDGHMYWHTVHIIIVFLVAGLLPGYYRSFAQLALLFHWILDLLDILNQPYKGPKS